MDDHQLVDQLLTRQESNNLDFKSQQYRFDADKKKSEFIKDILAMANTPRDGSAYILLGVSEMYGKAIDVVGVDEHHDESTLSGIVSGKVRPAPQFSYRQVSCDGKDLGLIEIPNLQPGGPFTPMRDFGSIRKGAFYIRRNSANVEASGDDVKRIGQASQFAPLPPSSQSGAWDRLYRVCDEFPPSKTYIAIMDREPSLDARDWAALASVDWNAIIDFDPGTDAGGNYALARKPFGERHALQLSALADVPEITARSTIWIAANGLTSMPTTKPVQNFRAWNRSKVGNLELALRKLASVTEPEPALITVFSGEPEFVETTLGIIDRLFSDRAQYVFASPRLGQYARSADRFDADEVSIALPEICQGLRERKLESLEPQEISFPKLEGGTAALPPGRARWAEEHLELVHRGLGSSSADFDRQQTAFLKGGAISWDVLYTRGDAERNLAVGLFDQISQQLKDRGTRRINLRHYPGAGASTLSRRVAWDFHEQYPTAVVREIQPQETANRIRLLFDTTNLPVLAVIDLPGAAQEEVDRLYDALRGSNTPAVLFSVERQMTKAEPKNRTDATFYLDARLKDNEAFILSNILSGRVPDRKPALAKLLNAEDDKMRTPFYFGLTAYGKDFQGLEPYVAARLSEAPRSIHQAALFIALAHYYGQVSLSLQTFAPTFGLQPSRSISYQRFPDFIRDLLVADTNKVRPAHYLISEEILQQGLVKGGVDRRNWKNGLADLAVEFIKTLSQLPHGESGTLSETLRSVLINRDPRSSEESTVAGWRGDFSQFLEDIPSPDGQRRVLKELTDAFPEEPHFWAHLGRFYSFADEDHENARQAYQKAINLSPDDSLLRHMAGMGWRAELRRRLGNIDRSTLKEEESNLFELLREAASEFNAARRLNRRNEYNYISHIQMIHLFVGNVSRAAGYAAHETVRFLTSQGNEKYIELVDEARNLLSDLELVKGTEAPSQYQLRVQADLNNIYGKHSEALQSLDNVLRRPESFKPPVRRAIVRTLVDSRQGNWSELNSRQLARVVELTKANIDEEPASDYNLRLWLRSVRTEGALSIDRVAEQLAYKRLQNPSLDTVYYLYILKFLQLELGDSAVAQEMPGLIKECGDLARHLPRTTTSYEWLGKEHGLAALVHLSALGDWDGRFYSNPEKLKVATGHIARIQGPGNGQIELHSGLRAFFVPVRGGADGGGGYLQGTDIGREVEFFLGFSYDGLRAWSVKDRQ